MNFILIGLNHKTADVEIREQIAFDEKYLENALQLLNSKKNILGSVIISTCNRVEICVCMKNESPELIIEFLSEYHNIKKEFLEKYIYVKKNQNVFKHLIKVSAGIDSMVVGETQIFGQLKKSYQISLSKGYSCKNLNLMFQKINNITKKIRTETKIGKGAVSISFAAVELTKKIFSSLEKIKILLIGSGEVAELCALHLNKLHTSKIYISNRSKNKSVKLAEKFNGGVINYSELYKKMKDVDIVIVSTGAPHYVVTPEKLETNNVTAKNNTLFFIDISVPRNVDPDINKFKNIFLYNIDDLKEITKKNQKKREKEILKAEKIINDNMKLYYELF